MFPDVVELSAQRIRRNFKRGTQGRQQRLRFSTELGPRLKVGIRIGLQLFVGGHCPAQWLVVEQHAEGLVGGVLVRQPQQQKFFQRCFAVRQPLARAIEPLLRGQLPGVDPDVRKALRKRQQQGIDLTGADAPAEPLECVREKVGILLGTISLDDRMAQLVDQPHREKLPRMDHCAGIFNCRWTACRDASVVHLLRKPPAGRDVAEDHITRIRKQQVPQLKPITERTRYVKLHGYLKSFIRAGGHACGTHNA